MNEGSGVFCRGVDQHGSYTVGAGHLQDLVSGEEKLEKQIAKSAPVTSPMRPESPT